MFEALSRKIASTFVEKGISSDAEKEVYFYGTEVVLTLLLNSLILITISVVLNKTEILFAYICFFPVLRQSLGGYHAKTHLGCVIFTGITFIIMIILSAVILENRITISALLCAVATLIVLMFSPAENKNKPLTEKEKKHYRKVSIVMVLIMSVLVLFGRFFIDFENFYFVGSIAMFFEAVSALPLINK